MNTTGRAVAIGVLALVGVMLGYGIVNAFASDESAPVEPIELKPTPKRTTTTTVPGPRVTPKTATTTTAPRPSPRDDIVVPPPTLRPITPAPPATAAPPTPPPDDDGDDDDGDDDDGDDDDGDDDDVGDDDDDDD